MKFLFYKNNNYINIIFYKMKNTNRKIITFENEIILTITFDKSIGREFSQKIVCYSNQKFNKIINDFLLKNNIKLKENYLLYLKRDNLLRKLL